MPLTWTADGTAVVVTHLSKQGVLAERLDMRTGQRMTLRMVEMSATNGFRPFNFGEWRRDGNGYAYGYDTRTFTLYTVTRTPQGK